MLENAYLEKNINQLKEIKTMDDVGEYNHFNIEVDFAEQYRDSDGIMHLKTMFSHEDAEENELWEVFGDNDQLKPLELLIEF